MADAKPITSKPDYEGPPVVEVILGVQFDRLPTLKNAHLGAFWKSLGQEWPTVSDAPPLLPQFERFAESAKWSKAVARVTITSDQASRVRIKNRQADQMIQVQNGRLHFNWLGEGGGKYPHYANVREGFTRALRQFMEFLRGEDLGAFKPNQWEVTYLNHIPQGTVWTKPQDWDFFRPLAGLPTVDGTVQGESFEGEWHFVIPEQRGRLHVNWQHAAKSEPEAKELIVLNLTARGPLESVEPDAVNAIVEGLNLGRDTIVRSFENLMSDEANKYWGLKHAGN
jgi:uncharacterized protein (TIGR04255 family)